MKDDYIKRGRTNQKIETRSNILMNAQYFLNNGLEFNLEDIAKEIWYFQGNDLQVLFQCRYIGSRGRAGF